MEKAKIKIQINDYKIENTGIIDNEILMVENNEMKVQYNFKYNLLIRTNSEDTIILDFKNNKFTYIDNNTHTKFSHKLVILKLTNEDKQVNISYQIDEEVFHLYIKHETI